MTRPRLVETGVALKLGKKTAEREVDAMVGKLAQAADSVIQALEAEHENWPQMGEASAATRGAEAHLLRAIRHVVIQDMLDRVR